MPGASPIGMTQRSRYRLVMLLLALVALAVGGCSNGPDARDHFEDSDTIALAQAVSAGDENRIRTLIRGGTSVNVQQGQEYTMLQWAIVTHSQPGLRTLLAEGADPNQVGRAGRTALHTAAFEGDGESLRALLEAGGDPDVRNPMTGETPLFQALLSTSDVTFDVLLDANADVNVADPNGGTPLQVAGSTNNGAAVLALLERGADPLAKSSGGHTFQDGYFGINPDLLNERGVQEHREVVAWLDAHDIPVDPRGDRFR